MKVNRDPLFARVIIEREKKEKTEGGIIIPDDSQKRHSLPQGTVLKVGPNCDQDIKGLVGKKVMFSQHAGAWDADNENVFWLNEEDLWGVINE